MLKNKMFRYLLIAVVVLVIVAVVGRKAGWVGGEGETTVAVSKAAKVDITEMVSSSGKIFPVTEVKISADVSGEVVELNVKEGQVVNKGDLMARINPDIYQSSLDRIEASLNTTKANLANSRARLSQASSQLIKAESSFKRSQKLRDDKVIAEAEYETALSAYEVAKAEREAAQQSVVAAEFGVKSAEASLKEARENLQKTSIIAPVSGTISKLGIEKGERVVGTSQMAGTEMMRIANLREMEVRVDVSENDIIRVKLGDTCEVDVDAYPDRKFIGLVTEIANSANITGIGTDQVTNFTVRIRLQRDSYEDLIPEKDDDSSPFRPGMSASVDIMTRKVFSALSVPIQAVTTRDSLENDQKEKIDAKDNQAVESAPGKVMKTDFEEYVFMVENDKAVLRKVKTGIQDNINIQILEGLKEGDEVISGPYSAVSRTLKDGSKVKVVDKSELFKAVKKETP